jgi:shikimate kinase / 3-dehydroquinate synthase
MSVRTRDVALVGSSEEALRAAADGVRGLGTAGGRVTTLNSAELGPAAAREVLAHHLVIWVDADDGAPAAWHPWQAADLIIPQSRVTEIARIAGALEAMPPGTKLLWATTAGGDYPVYVGPGLLTEPAFWPATTVVGRRFLVTDYNAGRLYAERLEPLDGRVTIMPGEQSKTIAHAEIVWTELARAGMTRADIVVALGGGVVGDLAGFCAATYQRGVRIVQVPTTLVAQVDSALGGKTGVDLPEAKNYVGAYHQPQAVIADTDALATLPGEELAAGYAEVVKTALIAGGALWDLVRGGARWAGSDWPEVVAACAHTKLRIVARDERDGGARQSLNLGHTVGHAIEAVTGYATYRHGEAVALGLLAALRLSGNDDLRAEVAELLHARGLPTEMRDVDPAAVVMATARDKKRTGEGPVPFVLLPEPGDPRPGSPVAPRELIAAVRELAR